MAVSWALAPLAAPFLGRPDAEVWGLGSGVWLPAPNRPSSAIPILGCATAIPAAAPAIVLPIYLIAARPHFASLLGTAPDSALGHPQPVALASPLLSSPRLGPSSRLQLTSLPPNSHRQDWTHETSQKVRQVPLPRSAASRDGRYFNRHALTIGPYFTDPTARPPP